MNIIDYCRFMIGHSLGRMESRIKKFTPHCVCRYAYKQYLNHHKKGYSQELLQS